MAQGGYGPAMSRQDRRMQGARHRRNRPRRHPLVRLVRLLLVGAIVVVVLEVGLDPWILRIGGKFTPTMSWQGLGAVTASDGGRYELYAHFTGGLLAGDADPACGQFGCDNISGTARLCATNGSDYTFSLSGQVKAWLSTNGSRTDLDITGGSPVSLPDGWVVALHGVWHGDSLALASPDNSFTEVFTPKGAIRTVTSTADAGTATVTLRPGTTSDFSRACAAL